MGDPDQRLQGLIDMSSDVVEQAIQLQHQTQQAVVAMKAVSTALSSSSASSASAIESAARALPGRIEAAISKELTHAAEQAAATMVKRWDEANQAANRAAKTYAASLTQVLLIFGASLLLGLVSGAALAVWLLTGRQ